MHYSVSKGLGVKVWGLCSIMVLDLCKYEPIDFVLRGLHLFQYFLYEKKKVL